jgi:ADP-ribosylation factor protein 1
MKVPEISEQLGLHQLRTRDWFIQGCCALTGEGLYDGLDWMTKAISKKK